MSEPAPWLSIIGMGEDGRDGLSAAARAALAGADVVIGPPRHLALAGPLTARVIEWPVPFADGIERLLALRGRRVAMLASGDPFWFGAGSSVAAHLLPHEWVAHPAPGTFALAAARLGWALQDCACLGLHAAPLSRLRPYLAPGARALVLLRDGAAVADLAAYLVATGFGETQLHVLEALGGPRERVRQVRADGFALADVAHPVAVGLAVAGDGLAMPVTAGRPDALFAADGQITKAPVRALTLAALAPRAGELLWDIGAGSGSIGIEWLLAHPANRAVAVEADPLRADRARANAMALGVDRLHVITGRAPACLPDGRPPDAVFIGGGLNPALLDALWACLPKGTRVVANAVTLESEALLAQWHAQAGGSLLRIELADATALGSRRGWKARYPLVQWSAVR
ncbi:precorrin-6y C5,15-methyltransferase (decarboxylating) subunit CbiE [Novosphingobium sp. SG720]|uniref:precorrin-6y C5,15-methyltransferase (decarboxylating) subunit CbiE n=1 Tax=Novosphingobium sp. SG720 TaxID=2586998 RepID=UPI001445F703|nr:precorrin-6y C5,15-methyltransferase (decarboxylating) subunit CbiE [Novosphingobium sp. SG720]NKJ43723.1 precorrin-6Y C5,15-methyltransferase (decarboxylating) [Novosphingobium sp. SG720]